MIKPEAGRRKGVLGARKEEADFREGGPIFLQRASGFLVSIFDDDWMKGDPNGN